jgi:hypothetical protein
MMRLSAVGGGMSVCVRVWRIEVVVSGGRYIRQHSDSIRVGTVLSKFGKSGMVFGFAKSRKSTAWMLYPGDVKEDPSALILIASPPCADGCVVIALRSVDDDFIVEIFEVVLDGKSSSWYIKLRSGCDVMRRKYRVSDPAPREIICLRAVTGFDKRNLRTRVSRPFVLIYVPMFSDQPLVIMPFSYFQIQNWNRTSINDRISPDC